MSLVLLVRHGQASFGAEPYDRLSQHGIAQAQRLGRALRDQGVTPTHIYSGSMSRHLQTAEATIDAAGWAGDVVTSPNWNEFDHLDVLAAHGESYLNVADRHAFLSMLDRSTARWAAGGHDGDYVETFDAFTSRVHDGLAALTTGLRGRTVVAFTSGGAISWVTASLLGGGYDQWRALNRVTVNTGVTKLVVGRSGTSLVSFNDHSHLRTGDVTYL